jgi:hypothetical protein
MLLVFADHYLLSRAGVQQQFARRTTATALEEPVDVAAFDI